MLGDSATCVGFGFRSRVPAELLAGRLGAFPDLRTADVVFGNLEASLSDVGWSAGDWSRAQMRGRPEYAKVLAEAGFNVLNVANNHALQHGPSAFAETVGRLRDAGIGVCGLRGAAPWSSLPVRLEARGLRIGVLAYCCRPRQYGSEEPPYAEGDPGKIVADAERLAGEGRTVIVSLHWGEEFVARPSQEEVSLGRRIVDAGAAVVIGHHPHVPRPVERYRGAVIAYSLGNFAADMIWHEPLRHGLVLDCRLGGGAMGSLAVRRHHIDGAYLPDPTATPVPDEAVVGLERNAYVAEVARTVGRQRAALYGYTLRNVWRFSPVVLAAMARRTVRNKVAALAPRSRSNGS
jgi:poly-gamma-glutamate synthesis protein (capsule biosynthesis protein)